MLEDWVDDVGAPVVGVPVVALDFVGRRQGRPPVPVFVRRRTCPLAAVWMSRPHPDHSLVELLSPEKLSRMGREPQSDLLVSPGVDLQVW